MNFTEMSEIQLLMQAHKEMEKRRMEDFTEMSEIQLLMQAHKEMEKRRMEELLQEERERGVYSSEIREESGRKGTVLQERDRFSRMRWFLRDDWEGTGRKEPVFQERARLPEMRQRGEASDKQVVDRESFIVKLQPVRDVYQNIISEMSGAPNLLSDFGKAVLDKISTGTLGTVFAHFRGTGFRELRRECWKRRVLFEDPDFPADDSSLYYKSKPTEKEIVWMRPKEIVGEALSPRFIVGNKSRFDVKQGSLGDCWLLAALANLTLHDELFFRVVPPDQSFSPKIYAGIFHFQFWRYGQWVDVVIDDRLPTVDGKLCYMRSETKNEFWSALLEKAYAKLYGSYQHLEGGYFAEALEDFTGGLTEFFDLKTANQSPIDKGNKLAVLTRGMQKESLFGCSINGYLNEEQVPPPEDGLVRGHAYSIIALDTVNTGQSQTTLLRIRNPWGDSKKWNGPWSDKSVKWSPVKQHELERLGLKRQEDGEFWMSFRDFMRIFTQMECCSLSADIMDELASMTKENNNNQVRKSRQWKEKSEHGEWDTKKSTAGSYIEYKTFCNNTQYGVEFQISSDSMERDGKCTVIVALLQKERREKRSGKVENLCIGVSVFSSKEEGKALQSIVGKKPVAKTLFRKMREMTVRFRVPPGHYVVIPSIFNVHPDTKQLFLLRVFTEAEFALTRLR